MWLPRSAGFFVAFVFAGMATPAPASNAPLQASDKPKPTISPPATNLDEHLKRGLPTSLHQVVNWTGGKINFVCKDRFQYEGYDVEHVEMFQVQFVDSEEDTYNDFDTILLKGEASLHSVIAEAAIGLGRYASMIGMNYWENEDWLQAYGNDTAVLNAASQTSQQANFAQLTVVALADHQHPGFRNI
ncbi:hypothetical protein EJ07DRAFT_182801 [Lizonia empirigonia]|nr:hypothetical protein EJ07DRAFT_182801 [Lizonia empirigonia]